MIAIFKREVRSCFHGMIGFVLTAFMLAAAAIYFVALNLGYGLTDFGYGILPQLLRLFITVKTSDTQSAFNSLLALETSALNFLQVTGEVIL